MKVFALINLFLGGAAAAAAAAPQCKADNCARAVTGTAGTQTLGARSSDCQSFQTCTVTPLGPPRSTVTLTTTATSSAGSAPATATITKQVKRGAAAAATTTLAFGTSTYCPSDVPTYASACGTDRYASACSCLGVARSTKTATPPPATRTVTRTVAGPPQPSGVCAFFIIDEMGQSDCGCNYEVSCGHALCEVSELLAGTRSSDQCRDACDADVNCQGFSIRNDGVCSLCFSSVRTIIDSNFNNGRREGRCTRSECQIISIS